MSDTVTIERKHDQFEQLICQMSHSMAGNTRIRVEPVLKKAAYRLF